MNVLKWEMADLLKTSLIFFLILLLLRKKLNIGLVMLIASCIIFVLYRMPVSLIMATGKGAALNSVTIKLVVALSFIRIFELILREHAVLTEMMGTVKAAFRNRKIVAVSMPLLIGLIPSVGGAYFSAPMVAETTRDIKMSPEEKGFINYWFRHPWEYVLPLYPGVLLASAISKIEIYNLIEVNLSYAVLVVITGFIFSMQGLKGVIKTEGQLSLRGLWSFLPIFAVLVLVMIFHMELHYALIAIVLFLLLFYRYDLRSVFAALKHGFSLDVIILILGVMFFKEAMENSGAVKNLSQFFIREGIPVSPILFLLPFITGMLTGLTVGFVGSTFPLIISIAGGASLGAVSFAFASGFLGVLLSPIHICLILTREYFKADLWGIYKMMIPGCIVIFCGAVAEYLILK
jgi:integral membrane protein (TIGR00529 family)